MGTIIPRWEWRSFGNRFGGAEDEFEGLEPKDIQESEETYLLNETGGNIKIRNGLLEIKVLQSVNPAGLEQWIPVMKEGFPLSAALVAEIFKAMNARQPRLDRAEYNLEQFLQELIEPHADVRRVDVYKRRVRYVVGGCMSEVTEVLVGGKSTRTIAVEAENAQAVVDAVRSLGLSEYINISYPKGLKAFIEGIPPRYAVLDVGTNSVKFHIGEQLESGNWMAVIDRAEVTRLGEGLDESGVISDAASDRTASAIAGMAAEAVDNHCLAIAAVGTAGLRIARNADDVVKTIQNRTGVRIQVISGEEESRLAYLAVQSGLRLGKGSLVVFDTGGGSSQFTFGQGKEVLERFSVNVGAARYTERFGLDTAVSPEELEKALAAISADLSKIDDRPKPELLVGMGGAITNLTAVDLKMEKYNPDMIQGANLQRSEVERQIEMYRTRSSDERREIPGLQPKRAEVILAGACIVRTIMEKFGKNSLTVSDRGLRHGLLAERFKI